MWRPMLYVLRPILKVLRTSCRDLLSSILAASCWSIVVVFFFGSWSVLRKLAAFDRDYLLPTPSRLADAWKCNKMLDFSVQSRILTVLRVGDDDLFNFTVTLLWTPHSPSATAVGSKAGPIFLWCMDCPRQLLLCRGRLAIGRLVRMQRLVPCAIHSNHDGGTLGEEETSQDFDDHMTSNHVEAAARTRCIGLVGRRNHVHVLTCSPNSKLQHWNPSTSRISQRWVQTSSQSVQILNRETTHG